MNRRSIILAGVGASTILSGCNMWTDDTVLEFNYNNQTNEDITAFVQVHGNDGIYIDDSYDISGDETHSEEQSVEESGPFLLELSLNNESRSDYTYTIEEGNENVEINIYDSDIEFESY